MHAVRSSGVPSVARVLCLKQGPGSGTVEQKVRGRLQIDPRPVRSSVQQDHGDGALGNNRV
jgi:hypothetical protein